MTIRNIPERAKCPECGSENVKSKLAFTAIVAWAGKLLGVPTVKIYEKRCVECGMSFRFFGNEEYPPVHGEVLKQT